MNGGEAFRTGDWSKQEVALDASYRAMDKLLLHSTQWNYTADNTHDHGDQWNDEDLSIFSPEDVDDPADMDSGGRATRAFCRPYVRHWAGAPISMAFDLATGEFTASLQREAVDRRADRRVRAPPPLPGGPGGGGLGRGSGVRAVESALDVGQPGRRGRGHDPHHPPLTGPFHA